MRKNNKFTSGKPILLIVFLLYLSSGLMAQVDTTAKVVQADTIAGTQATKEKEKKKNEFILYAGVNVNQLSMTDEQVDATSALGYHLEVAYKQGRFFYWQVGARYNNAEYNFVNKANLH